MDWNLILEEDLLKEVGGRIRSLRKNSGMSQQDLADQIGLSRVSISEIERGKNTSLSSFLRMLKCFNLINELDEILYAVSISPKEEYFKELKKRELAKKKNSTQSHSTQYPYM